MRNSLFDERGYLKESVAQLLGLRAGCRRSLKLSPKKRVCAIGTYAVDGLMQATLAGITTAAEFRVEGAAMYTGLMEWCRLRLARNYLSKLKFHLIILYQTNQLNYFLRCK